MDSVLVFCMQLLVVRWLLTTASIEGIEGAQYKRYGKVAQRTED